MPYLVGKIIGTHGIKGELKVKSDTSFNRFEKGSYIYINVDSIDKTKLKKFEVTSHRVHQGFDLITINNLFDINMVLGYVEKEIYVKEHNREKDNAKVYYEDLIGSEVIDEESNKIGVVNDIVELPKGILLEVLNGKKRSLIPYVDEFIKNVDPQSKKIVIHLIEGLI